MAKMLVMPVLGKGKVPKTYAGERLLNVYDSHRVDGKGNILCVAKDIPEGAVLLEWEEYIKQAKGRAM